MLNDYLRTSSFLPVSILLGAAFLAGCSGGGGSVGPASVANGTVVPTQAPTMAPTVAPTAAPSAQSTPTTTGLYVEADSPNEILSVQTTLIVPAEPPATGSLLVAPALSPVDDLNPSGVIAPVLTWGPSCAPGQQPAAYSTWWVSAQYDTGGSQLNGTACQGGPIMPVNAGDSLQITMLAVSPWTETILDLANNHQVSYQASPANQQQNKINFSIEGSGQNLVSSVSFSDTTIHFETPPANGCVVLATALISPNDTYSAPEGLQGGHVCRIANITLFSPAGPVQSDRVRTQKSQLRMLH